MAGMVQLIVLCIILMHHIVHSSGRARSINSEHLQVDSTAGNETQCNEIERDYYSSSTWWIAGSWILVLVFTIGAIVESYYNTPIVETVFDGCPPTSGVYSYLIKLRTGILPGQFYVPGEKKAVIALDINDKKENFITRLRVPILPVEKGARNTTKGEVRQSIKFKVIREEPMPTMKTIRIDHNCHTESIYVFYIEIRDLGNVHNVFKAIINCNIKELTPLSPFRAELFELKSSQGRIDADTNAPNSKNKDTKEEFDSEVPANLSLIEHTLFIFLALNLLYLGCMYWPVDICDFTTDTSIVPNSLVDAAFTLVIEFIAIVSYKWVKSSQSSEISWTRIMVAFGYVVAALCSGGWAIFRTASFGADQLKYWAKAFGLASLVFLVIYIPVCIAINFWCVPKRPTTLKEDTVSSKDKEKSEEIKSDLGKALKEVVVAK